MRLKGRMKKLEVLAAPPPARCDCPITWHSRLADGSIYPPSVPCLRGKCPEERRWRNEPRPIRTIVIGCAVRPEGGPPPGYPISARQFRAWDPETDRPRLRVIVWRDKEGRLRYHGPPRWYEIGGIEEPRVVRAHDVYETLAEIVAELRRTDETPSQTEMNATAIRADEWLPSNAPDRSTGSTA
jgi:hypothetical protein